MQNEKRNTPNVEAQYRTMIMIWAALLMSQLIFLFLVFVTRPKLFQLDLTLSVLGEDSRSTGGTTVLILSFAVAAVTAVLLSFAFKRRLNERAIATRDTAQVQAGLIIALALCEASSLFGLALAFAFDYQYFFAWIALGILGLALHFPKRETLHAASVQ